VSSPYQPPPDITGYIDLRIFDRSDQDLIDTALAAAQVNLPEWQPVEGHTEVLLIEALALELSEAIVAVNRLPGALLEALLRFAGVSRDFGAAPVATATVVCADALGHDIPGGTRIYAPTADGSGVVVMLVEPPGLTIAAGASSGSVNLIADTYTSAANGVPSGTLLATVSPLPFIETVQLTTAIADGRDPETDTAWRDRGVNRLARLTEALVLPSHFEAAALEDPDVARVIVVDNNDPGTGGSGDDPGHVTVAVLGVGGALLSAGAKTALQATLSDQASANLLIHVVDAAIQVVTVAVVVHLADASDPSAVTAAVETAVIDYIDPVTWEFGAVVRGNEIISLCDGVGGVDYVSSVTITGAVGGNLTLSTPMTLPDASPASVTVTTI